MPSIAPSPAAELLEKANSHLMAAWQLICDASNHTHDLGQSDDLHELMRRIDVIQEYVTDLQYSDRVPRELEYVPSCTTCGKVR